MIVSLVVQASKGTPQAEPVFLQCSTHLWLPLRTNDANITFKLTITAPVKGLEQSPVAYTCTMYIPQAFSAAVQSAKKHTQCTMYMCNHMTKQQGTRLVL